MGEINDNKVGILFGDETFVRCENVSFYFVEEWVPTFQKFFARGIGESAGDPFPREERGNSSTSAIARARLCEPERVYVSATDPSVTSNDRRCNATLKDNERCDRS